MGAPSWISHSASDGNNELSNGQRFALQACVLHLRYPSANRATMTDARHHLLSINPVLLFDVLFGGGRPGLSQPSRYRCLRVGRIFPSGRLPRCWQCNPKNLMTCEVGFALHRLRPIYLQFLCQRTIYSLGQCRKSSHTYDLPSRPICARQSDKPSIREIVCPIRSDAD